MPKLLSCPNSQQYSWIIVGSGNGACAFLNQYLSLTKSSVDRVLVLEEGENFFETSDITHQRNWTRSYSQGNIFKLHDAKTSDGTPILSGRACTMGGGGSINYTMIFESSAWLSKSFGHDLSYWDGRKEALAKQFERRDPKKDLTPIAKYIRDNLLSESFNINNEQQGNIPEYREKDSKQIHIFPTQFDEFGQRIHSGISLVEWYHNKRLDFMPQCRVTRLELTQNPEGSQRCTAIFYLNLETGAEKRMSLGVESKLLLCAGAMTPQLLYEYRECLENLEIGKYVNDHILLPFGIYLLKEDLSVSPKDQYVSLFATTEEFFDGDDSEEPTICNFDFFSGSLDTLLYLISHLFLAFWVPNWLKSWMIQKPKLFEQIKCVSRRLVDAINLLDDVLWSLRYPRKIGKHRWNLISAIVKFNIHRDGYYRPALYRRKSVPNQSALETILPCFEKDEEGREPDIAIAKAALEKQIELMGKLGAKPHPFFQWLIRLLTKMPYEESQVDAFIDHYRRYDLLTEQHLSGGCVFGKAIDLGTESPQDTGKVFGSENVYVADLSASPLPRVSPQMTAYLIGHHVATQHCQNL